MKPTISPVTKRTFERGVFDDLRVGAREIETHAAVFSLHARRKFTPFLQIDYCNLHSQSPWFFTGILLIQPCLHDVVQRLGQPLVLPLEAGGLKARGQSLGAAEHQARALAEEQAQNPGGRCQPDPKLK